MTKTQARLTRNARNAIRKHGEDAALRAAMLRNERGCTDEQIALNLDVDKRSAPSLVAAGEELGAIQGIESEPAAAYSTGRDQTDEDAIIARAIEILGERCKREQSVTSSAALRQLLCLKFAQLNHEVFSVVMMDNQNQLIDIVELFEGTIDGCAVYPRRVAELCLQHGAAAVALVHNHPSFTSHPSHADRMITKKLQQALDLFEIRVLDHIIVGGAQTYSFAEMGDI